MKKFIKVVAIFALAVAFVLPGAFMCLATFDVGLSGSGISINGDYIFFNSETTVQQLIDALKIPEGATISVYSNKVDVTSNTTDKVKTGDSVNITSNEEIKAYTVIIRGDVNKDGQVNADDYELVVNHVNGTSTFANDSIEKKALVSTGTLGVSVTCDDTVYTDDTTFTVSLKITPSSSVSYFEFELDYPMFFSYDDDYNITSKFNGWTISVNDDSEGYALSISAYKTDFTGITSASDFLMIKFNMSNTAAAGDSDNLKVLKIKGVSNSGEVLSSGGNVSKKITVAEHIPVVVPTVTDYTSDSITLGNLSSGYYYAVWESGTSAPAKSSSAWKTVTSGTELEFTNLDYSTEYFIYYKTGADEEPQRLENSCTTKAGAPAYGPEIESSTASSITIAFGDFEEIYVSKNSTKPGTGTSAKWLKLSSNFDLNGTYDLVTGGSVRCSYSIDRNKRTVTLSGLSPSINYIWGKTADGLISKVSTEWSATPSLSEENVEKTSTGISVPYVRIYQYSIDGKEFVLPSSSNAQYLDTAKRISIKNTDENKTVITGFSSGVDYKLYIRVWSGGIRSDVGVYDVSLSGSGTSTSDKPANLVVSETTDNSITIKYDSTVAYQLGSTAGTWIEASFFTDGFPTSNSPERIGNYEYYFDKATNPTKLTFTGLTYNTNYTIYYKYADKGDDEIYLKSSVVSTKGAATGKPETPETVSVTMSTITLKYDSSLVYRLGTTGEWTGSSYVKYPIATGYVSTGSYWYYFDKETNPTEITFAGLIASTAYTVSIKYAGASDETSNITTKLIATAVDHGKPTFPSETVTDTTVTFVYNSELKYRIEGVWINVSGSVYPTQTNPAKDASGRYTYYFDNATKPTKITFAGLEPSKRYSFYVKYADDATGTNMVTKYITTKSQTEPITTKPTISIIGSFESALSFGYEAGTIYRINSSAWTQIFTTYPTSASPASLGSCVYYFNSATAPTQITFASLQPSTSYLVEAKYSNTAETAEFIASNSYSTMASSGPIYDKPAAPTLVNKSATEIEVAFVDDVLYSIDGSEWTGLFSRYPTDASPAHIGNYGYYFDDPFAPAVIVFTDLEPDTIYTVRAKKAETEDVSGNISQSVFKTDDKPLHEHTLVERVVKPATCTEEGLVEIVCEECDEVIETRILPKLQHQYEWVVVKEATEDEEGIMQYVCKVGGEVIETKRIAKLPKYIKEANGMGTYEVQIIDGTDISGVIKKAASEGNANVTLVFDNIKVKLDPTMVLSFTNEGASVNIKQINNAQQASGDLAKAGFDLASGAVSAYEITAEKAMFTGSGKATVSLPYTVAEGNEATVYFVDSQGNKTKMKSSYSNGVLTFETSHFSTYVVEQARAKQTSGVVIAIIAVLAVLMATGATFAYIVYKSKHGKARNRFKL